MHHDLGVGEELATPRGQSLGRALQLVEKDVTRVNVMGWSIPSLIDDLHKPGHLDPKVFKLESPRSPWTPIIRKKQRAMVREGRRQGGEHMGVVTNIPLIIAIEGV
jgi:hypothetical protein